MDEGRERLEQALHVALSGRVCVSAWLGYGNPLFVGFGSHLIPIRDADGCRAVPPAEIQTSMADWRVGQVTGEDEPPVAQEAVESLIGLRVVSWRLKENGDVRVELTEGKSLEIVCAGAMNSDLNEWWVCCPKSRYIGIGPNRNVIEGDTTVDAE